tara:strand:- start:75 stop:677 length:603 start_codon:yes stop_codon:yes gene_type:complete
MNNTVKTIVAARNIKGASIIGIKNYTNTQGEVSNQSILVGFNYEKRLLKDLNSLKSIAVKRKLVELYKTETKKEVKKVYNKLVKSLIKRTSSEEVKAKLLEQGDETMVKSQAQIDAYVSIAKGLNAKDTNLYFKGLLMSKKVVSVGEYGEDKRTPYMILKNKIERLSKQMKYKTFKLTNDENLSVQGIKIEPQKNEVVTA